MNRNKRIIFLAVAIVIIIFIGYNLILNFLVSGFGNAVEGTTRAIIDLQDNGILDTMRNTINTFFIDTNPPLTPTLPNK